MFQSDFCVWSLVWWLFLLPVPISALYKVLIYKGAIVKKTMSLITPFVSTGLLRFWQVWEYFGCNLLSVWWKQIPLHKRTKMYSLDIIMASDFAWIELWLAEGKFLSVHNERHFVACLHHIADSNFLSLYKRTMGYSCMNETCFSPRNDWLQAGKYAIDFCLHFCLHNERHK